MSGMRGVVAANAAELEGDDVAAFGAASRRAFACRDSSEVGDVVQVAVDDDPDEAPGVGGAGAVGVSHRWRQAIRRNAGDVRHLRAVGSWVGRHLNDDPSVAPDRDRLAQETMAQERLRLRSGDGPVENLVVVDELSQRPSCSIGHRIILRSVSARPVVISPPAVNDAIPRTAIARASEAVSHDPRVHRRAAPMPPQIRFAGKMWRDIGRRQD